jgi:hypothetical protein
LINQVLQALLNLSKALLFHARMDWKDFTKDRTLWLHMLLIRILLTTYFLELLLHFTGKILSKIKTKVLLFLRKSNHGEDQKKLEKEEM